MGLNGLNMNRRSGKYRLRIDLVGALKDWLRAAISRSPEGQFRGWETGGRGASAVRQIAPAGASVHDALILSLRMRSPWG